MLTRLFASTSRRAPVITTTCRCYASIRPNQALLDMLKAEVKAEKAKPNVNRYKAKSLLNAMEAINKLDHDITSLSSVVDVSGIGKGILKRIQQYLSATQNPNQPQVKDELSLIMELESIHGIGKARARRLVEAGCNGLEGLKEERFFRMLTPIQKASIQYQEHLQKTATREQIDTTADFVRNNLSDRHEVIVIGDCRRGASTDTSIQLMLFHPDHVHVPVPSPPTRGSFVPHGKLGSQSRAKAETPLHKSVIPTLQERGLVVASMGTALRYWNGVVRIPEKDQDGKWKTRRERLEAIEKGQGELRRMDLFMIPLKSRGAALISHTGDGQMKMLLKRKADQLGLYLDELGLWKWHPENAAETVGDGDELSVGFWQLLQSMTEESIFEQLGMQYVEPRKRNLENLK
ncbi:hypothetical protein DXG03_007690 [Asterophora parasitica]|uniref:DNA polymerase n=1 Tax=Asterophora parasitica TaxID=117018 RepID=A0A9P7GCP3_9AGAR|nr:hypothetical protein DXG03_007690 [Asterophora parasitica]